VPGLPQRGRIGLRRVACWGVATQHSGTGAIGAGFYLLESSMASRRSRLFILLLGALLAGSAMTDVAFAQANAGPASSRQATVPSDAGSPGTTAAPAAPVARHVATRRATHHRRTRHYRRARHHPAAASSTTPQ